MTFQCVYRKEIKMNKSPLSRLRQNIALTSSLFLVCTSANLLADVAGDTSVRCKMQLATSVHITLGEPVIVHTEVFNPSAGEKLWVGTGLYKTDWYRIDLTDQSGHTVSSQPDTRTREPKGAYGGDMTIVPPSGSVPLDIVVTRFLPLQKPGQYTLTVHIHAPYAQTEADSENVQQAKSQIKSGGAVLVKDFTFPLTVAPANLLTLQKRANALKQDILTHTATKSYYTDFDALFAMPEASAWTAWQTLASEGTLSTQEITVTKLGELHSQKAADLLIEMLDNTTQAIPGLPTVSDRILNDSLHEMYNNGSGALRAHIHSLYAQRGIQLPDKAEVSQVID
jgi:hypothetical protein